MIILGIDPGLAATGFGVIHCENGVPSLIKCGSIRTSPGQHVSYRLFQIHSDVNHVINSVHPDLIAVENAFSLVRYPKAGILLGGVLGIIYLSVFQNNLSMIELTPKEIKNALAGYGGADKRQMSLVVRKLLRAGHIRSPHASDALAVALTAFYRKALKDTR